MSRAPEPQAPRLKKGHRVLCACKAHIATIARDVFKGEKVSATMFEESEGQGPWKAGESAKCRKCGAHWIVLL